MENALIKECLEILNQDNVKTKLKSAFTPLTEVILRQIYPYIYMIILIVVLIFILILAILILLITILRSNAIALTFSSFI
jgi:hypothetical protein